MSRSDAGERQDGDTCGDWYMRWAVSEGLREAASDESVFTLIMVQPFSLSFELVVANREHF